MSDLDALGSTVLRIREMGRSGNVSGLIHELSNDLESKSLAARAVAIRHLAKLGDPQATRHIERLLRNDTREDVRVIAAHALGEVANPDSLETLTLALKESSLALQTEAARSLGKIGASVRFRLLRDVSNRATRS